jgi:hypothetical protein
MTGKVGEMPDVNSARCADERRLDVMVVSDVERIAHISGASSAARRALADLKKRRQAGEDAHIFWDRRAGSFIVGPMPSAPRPDAKEE